MASREIVKIINALSFGSNSTQGGVGVRNTDGDYTANRTYFCETPGIRYASSSQRMFSLVQVVNVSNNTNLVQGDVITGGTSGNTGTVVGINNLELSVVLQGPLTGGETVTSSGGFSATVNSLGAIGVTSGRAVIESKRQTTDQFTPMPSQQAYHQFFLYVDSDPEYLLSHFGKEIDVSGNKKVYIEIPEFNIEDQTLNTDVNGEGIGFVTSSTDYPTHISYVPLREITGGDWYNATDVRQKFVINGKNLELSDYNGDINAQNIVADSITTTTLNSDDITSTNVTTDNLVVNTDADLPADTTIGGQTIPDIAGSVIIDGDVFFRYNYIKYLNRYDSAITQNDRISDALTRITYNGSVTVQDGVTVNDYYERQGGIGTGLPDEELYRFFNAGSGAGSFYRLERIFDSSGNTGGTITINPANGIEENGYSDTCIINDEANNRIIFVVQEIALSRLAIKVLDKTSFSIVSTQYINAVATFSLISYRGAIIGDKIAFCYTGARGGDMIYTSFDLLSGTVVSSFTVSGGGNADYYYPLDSIQKDGKLYSLVRDQNATTLAIYRFDVATDTEENLFTTVERANAIGSDYDLIYRMSTLDDGNNDIIYLRGNGLIEYDVVADSLSVLGSSSGGGLGSRMYSMNTGNAISKGGGLFYTTADNGVAQQGISFQANGTTQTDLYTINPTLNVSAEESTPVPVPLSFSIN